MPIGRRIVAAIWGKATVVKGSDVQKLLEQLANASGPAIRSLVEKAAKERNVPKEDAEELIQLLTNLSKNARFHTTNGTKLSTVVQTEKLIEKLLTNFQPKRSRGEPVSPNSDWVLDQFLGMGGFGEVWRAKNSLFHGARAFKFFTDPAHQEWLKKEGQALAKVKEELGDHPNIVQYIDIATQATPYPYLALDFANGGSLEDWIDQPPQQQADLNIDDLMSDIIDGLCEARASHIYHRDIKPANILLNRKSDDDPPTRREMVYVD